MGDHRRENKHLKDPIGKLQFVDLRQKRDATLTEPKLLHQAMQVNLRAGRLPELNGYGQRMLYTPLKLKECKW